MKRIFALCALLVVSCGKDEGGGSEESESKSRRAMLVATAEDLPECTAEDEGWLIYVKDSGANACLSGKWESIESEPASLVEKHFYCTSAEFDLGNGVEATGDSLSITLLVTGDVLASCSSTATAGTAVDSDAGFSVYPVGTDGAKKPFCGSGLVPMEFDFETKAATYSATNSEDKELKAAVACTQTFPK